LAAGARAHASLYVCAKPRICWNDSQARSIPRGLLPSRTHARRRAQALGTSKYANNLQAFTRKFAKSFRPRSTPVSTSDLTRPMISMVYRPEERRIAPSNRPQPRTSQCCNDSAFRRYTTYRQIAEQFAGRSCAGILDLYVGYDERALDESSHDYTTFQTPLAHFDSSHFLWVGLTPFRSFMTMSHSFYKPNTHTTIPYIDDVPIRGPATRYILQTDVRDTPSNFRIRRFIWEYFQG